MKTNTVKKLRSLNFGAVSARAVALVLALGVALGGCRERASKPGAASEQAPIPAVERLPPELAKQVLAKVGDTTITLADYAVVLDRMDQIERMRYQTPERRRALLDEIINAELLAKEAERRGLDKDPATIAYIDQLFRDEIRRRLRSELPAPQALPIEAVQAFYAEHREEFRTPELRRIAAIAVPNEAAAAKVLAELGSSASVVQWNTVALRHSVDSREPGLAVDVMGDMGLVTAPSSEVTAPSSEVTAPPNASTAAPGGTLTPPFEPEASVGVSSRVPAALRSAAFSMAAPGEVYNAPIRADGKVYLLRLLSINPARTLSLEEAEAEIRTRLSNRELEAKFAELERQLAAVEPPSDDPAAVTAEGE